MIVSDVITRVRRIFGDEAAVQLQDADIIRWINDGQLELVRENDSVLQATDTIDIVANQQEYTMPANLLILRAVRWKYSSFLSFSYLKYLSLQQFDETVDGWDGTAYGTSHPAVYTKYENKIALFPIPNESATDGLKIIYNKRPTDVVLNSDSISVPELYHPTIVKFCIWQASLLDEDYEPAVMHQTNYTKDVDSLANRETLEPTDRYPVITVLAEDAW
jgi:hypothetical protein